MNYKIQVRGVGITKFGELWDKTFFDLCLEASQKAIKDSGIDKKKIDAVYVGNMIFGKISEQDHIGAVVSSSLGLNSPAYHIEAACASGGEAINLAIHSLMAGAYKNVLVVGAEKMTDASTSEISAALMGAGSERERIAGLTFPALYALMAKMHMQEFGTKREQLAAVASKNHFHASLNPNAQFPFEVSIDKVLASPIISDPFTLFDSSPITDGAAAVVLSTEKNGKGVYITASSVATDTIDLAERESLTKLNATRIASKNDYKQEGVYQQDIDVVEFHDCFTIDEILAMEDLGFCKKGDGGEFIASGHTRLGGKMPVNTSGGLKACGHPVGATGVKQIIEITEQLRGTLGKRQVKNPKVGLTQNVGGTGATVVVHVLQK